MTLYIDPGTGSMLFTVMIGIVGAAVYSLRMLLIKLRFRLSGGKAEVSQQEIPLLIFSDHKRYWPIFEPVCRELDKLGMDVVYWTASPDDPALTCPYSHVKAEFIGEDNKAFAKLNYVNATIIFSTTPGLDVYQWKRSPGGRYYVHIAHNAAKITMYRMFGIDYYDAILYSDEYQYQDIRQLEKLRNLSQKELVKVGIPYMDEMVTRLEQAGPAPEHPRTVLLAPTWGPSGIFQVYGSKLIDLLLETGYHVIIRPHPQSFDSEKELMEKLQKEYPESDQLEWNRDNDNFEVLRRSDILISDFSAVVFDFALVYDKPIIYTEPNFDIGIYDAWWLDTPLWTVEALPMLGQELNAETMPRLKDLIDTCLEDSRYTASRQEAKAITWAYPGEGARRTAEYLVQKYQELTNAKGN